MKKLFICLLVLGFILSFQTPILAQNSEKLFQQGMMKEEGEGNLEEAIVLYNMVANNVSAERNIRAKSLLQVGICYEKLGNKNARKTYQKLISEFSDQTAIVDFNIINSYRIMGIWQRVVSPSITANGYIALHAVGSDDKIRIAKPILYNLNPFSFQKILEINWPYNSNRQQIRT